MPAATTVSRAHAVLKVHRIIASRAWADAANQRASVPKRIFENPGTVSWRAQSRSETPRALVIELEPRKFDGEGTGRQLKRRWRRFVPYADPASGRTGTGSITSHASANSAL